MIDMDTRKVEFRGWSETLPQRAAKRRQLSEYDLLRIVILAEADDKRRWVEFRCEDKMHAIKVANLINTFGFDVDVVARDDSVFARRSE